MDLTERIARDAAVLARLGIAADSIAAAQGRLSMTVRADMLNAGGVCHGALLFGLADTACAYALAEAAVSPVTVDANITFLRAARSGDAVTAAAQVVRAGRRLGHCEVKLTLADDTIIALYRATCANLGDQAL